MEYNFKINRRVAKKLKEEFYKINYADIAKLYNTSREAVRRLFSDKYNEKNGKNEIDKVTNEELEYITKMIQKKLYNYNVGNIKLTLINNLKGKFAFIIKKKNETKVVFNDDFKEEEKWKGIIKVIKENRLNELAEEEIELIEKSMELIVMKKKYFRPNNYEQFHKLKKIRNMTENEYVKFLGYENFAPKKIENTDDKILEFFENNLIEGKVNIEYNSWIRNYISRQNMSVEEFVSFFGYEQHNTRSNNIKKEIKTKCSKKYINAILEKLEVEQKNKDKIREIKCNEKLIVDRSKEMIQELKDLYGGKCQICQNKLQGEIIQKNNKIYCEAHHIKELSKAKINIESENEILDHYKNIVILCPHHHRYLHYNKGGDYKLINNKGELFFENNFDKVKIELNYHL